jgi:hypothetical protein
MMTETQQAEGQAPLPGQGPTRTILSTLDEVRAASVEVANAATRLLAMYTRDLEPLVYDQPKFIDAIKKLVLARGYAKVRVLLADPAKTVYDSSRFIGLARRITSYIEIRHAHPDFRVNRAAFLIADDRAIVYRSDAARWDGILEMNDPAVARRYLDYFNEAWLGSAPHAETRQLHL